ncbi:MAG: hypothetical protein WCS53_01895 [Bacilli bacterium]|jgi:hypothetical protein
MQTHEKKILKIIDVLYTYCKYIGGNDISIRCQCVQEHHYTLTVRSNYAPVKRQYIANLEVKLNTPKNLAVEELYWQVMGIGSFEDDNDIYVVGSMVDTAEVTFDDPYFELVVTRTHR